MITARLISIILFVFTACSIFQSSHEEYYILPLMTGNEWTYSVKSGSETGEFTLKFVNTKKIDNVSAFITAEPLFDNNAYYYTEGTLIGCEIANPEKTKEIVFPSRPQVGEKWIVDTDNWSIESLDEKVAVPAGSFSAIKIKITKGKNISYLWFTKNIGIIKAHLKGSIMELIHYKLN